MSRVEILHLHWLLQRLREAKDRVQQGELHVARQRNLVLAMESLGQDASDARRLLDTFVELQRLRVGEQERLQKELSDSKAGA